MPTHVSNATPSAALIGLVPAVPIVDPAASISTAALAAASPPNVERHVSSVTRMPADTSESIHPAGAVVPVAICRRYGAGIVAALRPGLTQHITSGLRDVTSGRKRSSSGRTAPRRLSG